MNIFISWSGKLSEQLASQIKEWLPNVIQRARPFISNESIRKGQKWFLEISKELSKVSFGILCLTKDNIEAPWLIFEAGALSKQIEDSHVCPILFGGLRPKDITGSLSNFQHTIFSKDDFFKLIETINTNLSETEKLSEKLLANAFEKWWPDLENSISNILETVKEPQAPSKSRPNSDILEEVLYLTREMSKTNLEILSAQKIINRFGGIDFSQFDSETEVFYKGDNFNHPIRVRIFPYDSEPGSEAGDKQIIITRAGVNLEDFHGEYQNGVGPS
jgi:hypothetical protein